MTDKEKVHSLLSQLGVYFTKSPDESSFFIEVDEHFHTLQKLVDGYSGFYCRYDFTPEGKFIRMFMGE